MTGFIFYFGLYDGMKHQPNIQDARAFIVAIPMPSQSATSEEISDRNRPQKLSGHHSLGNQMLC